VVNLPFNEVFDHLMRILRKCCVDYKLHTKPDGQQFQTADSNLPWSETGHIQLRAALDLGGLMTGWPSGGKREQLD